MKFQKSIGMFHSIRVKLGNGDRKTNLSFSFSSLRECHLYICQSPMQNKYIQLPERGERRRIQIQDPRLQTKIISLKEVRKSKREKKNT